MSEKETKQIKLKKIRTNKDERSSRFVVDLQQKENDKAKKEKKKKFVFEKIEKPPKKDFKKFFVKIKKQANQATKEASKVKKSVVQGAFDFFKILFLPFSFFTKIFLALGEYAQVCFSVLNQLAVFSLFKFILKIFSPVYKVIYNIFYKIGWVSIFVFNFVVLFTSGVARAVLSDFAKGFVLIKLGLLKIVEFFVLQIDRFINLIKYPFTKIVAGKKQEIAEQTVLEPIEPMETLEDEEDTYEYLSEDIQEESDYEEDDEVLFEEKVERAVSVWRSAMQFAFILFILVIPFKAFTYYKDFNLEGLKGRVLGVSEEAVSDLMTASKLASEFSFEEAGSKFSDASGNFFQAQKEIVGINDIFFKIASIVPNEKIKLASQGKQILQAGTAASSLGNNLSKIAESMFDNEDNNMFDVLNDILLYGEQAREDARILNENLAQINPELLGADIKDQFVLLKEKSALLEKELANLLDLTDSLRIFLGAEQKKRYLVVFQNNTELRATGGFIGSFALMDFNKGEINNLEVPKGGSYDTEGGLRTLVTAPQPLHLVNPLWHFWDANWWPDWETSAKKLMWFYEKSDGPTVDGVISLTPTVLEKMLKIIGPIDMQEQYGITIDADNFWLTVQSIVEEGQENESDKYIKTEEQEKNEPKKIIGDLLDKILADLPNKLNRENLIELLKITEESLSEKHILFYFTDDRLQKEVEKYGWDGKMKDTEWDYLSVINTNIAGGKSDKRMEEEINQTVEIMSDGSIINSLEIKRTHTGIKNEPYCGVRNVDWMRVYVPEGSELLEARGFREPNEIYFEEPEDFWEVDSQVVAEEAGSSIHASSGTRIYTENNKTVFANWSMVDPGETGVIYLRYKLPFTIEKEDNNGRELYPYVILVQKQAGAKASRININIRVDGEYRVVSKYPKEIGQDDLGVYISDKINFDKYWAVLLEDKIEELK